jgi:hypothetical protein
MYFVLPNMWCSCFGIFSTLSLHKKSFYENNIKQKTKLGIFADQFSLGTRARYNTDVILADG